MKTIKIILSLSIVLFTVTLFGACKKKETPTATITFNKPKTNDTIPNGSVLHIEGSIKGTGELHGYTISIIHQSSGAVLFTGSSDKHTDTYSFHEHWTNNVTDTSTIEVKIDVGLDHDGKKMSQSVKCVALK